MTNEYNPDGKEIRFIDSHYKDLFHIPDGSCVQIHYPDEMVVKPCTFIDEYHTQIGYNVFHICQFAEIMERNGASYMPEPEIMGDEAAWKVGKDRILAVQTCEDGYDYTLLDENYNEIDGGQVDNPELSMLEVRRDILESFGLERRELRAMFYEDVMEQAFEVGRQAVVVNDPIAELAFKLDRFAENFDPYEYMDQVDDVQAHIQEIKADLAAGNTAPYREFLNTAIEEAREETAVEVAKVLKSQLDKLDSPKRESVMEKLAQVHNNILGTRADADKFAAVQKVLPDAVYHKNSRLIFVERKPLPKDDKRYIAVVTAGTSDLPISEEAALTAEIMGNQVERVYDVGVAGIHRLFDKLDLIRNANVVIVVAGMEGALASVVGGLVERPVIAVPTSVGYGANFQGLSALLGMLNSCSAGVAVVNIDNGFGAGRMASIINHMR